MAMRRRFMQDSRIDVNKYLTFVARENNTSISLLNYKSIGYGGFSDIQYSINGEHFIEGDVNNIIINSGETLSVKATYHAPQTNPDEVFIISRPVDVIGTISSILATPNRYNYIFYNTPIVDASLLSLPATTLWDNCYAYMFSGCASLTTAPELPATTLASSCYEDMFSSCRSLTTAPELPATTLTESCYNGMFRNCTGLNTAPELPATTLANYCYYDMFQNCTKLTSAPALPATTSANGCYQSMFSGCTSLTTAPELPVTTLSYYCYFRMFQGCASLTTAPELPATTLAPYCYAYMFYGCSKLNYIKMLATDISAVYCLYNWVSGVASTGTFVKHPDMTSLPTGANGIPSGWTVVDDGDVVQKTVNHGVITRSSSKVYTLTFEFPIACKYMTVECGPQFWYLTKGCTQTISDAPEGLGDTIEIYASNNGYDDYNATNEDDTYIYEVTINV